jgi:uncharacterized lipoprotein YddW (UPF0748 family)
MSDRMKVLLASLLLLAAATAPPPAPAPAPSTTAPPPLRPPEEMRGVWVVRTALTSPAAVDAAVEEAARAGANALFIQVRGRGDAFYDSQLVERSELLARQPAGFDPFQRAIEEARARGLAVHAWFNVLLVANFSQRLSPGHVLSRHPEWAMQPRRAARRAFTADPRGLPWLAKETRDPEDVEGQYLSPSAPGVADHLEAAVRELMRRYPVDGFHLDFIRYPSRDYDYSRSALEGFARTLVAPGDPVTAPDRNVAAWDEYRRSVLTQLAVRLAGAARAERRGVVVSAAVVPDEATAISQKFQDWPDWGVRRIVDALCPMAYSADSRVFRQQVEQARARVGDRAPVWAGVGAYRLDTGGIIEKVRLAREAGAAGSVLFSHESLEGQDLARLRREAWAPSRPAGAAAAAQGEGAGGR